MQLAPCLGVEDSSRSERHRLALGGWPSHGKTSVQALGWRQYHGVLVIRGGGHESAIGTESSSFNVAQDFITHTALTQVGVAF